MLHNRVVYLAGGFHSGWQDLVKAKADLRFGFFDPRTHGLTDPEDYTEWDLDKIDKCGILFACVELDNPGINMALEIGYAHARGIPIILVDGQPDNKYWSMARVVALRVEKSLLGAIRFLNAMLDERPYWR